MIPDSNGAGMSWRGGNVRKMGSGSASVLGIVVAASLLSCRGEDRQARSSPPATSVNASPESCESPGAAATAPAPSDVDRCRDILQLGVFESSVYQTDTQFRERLDRAMCASDFGTHQDAQSYGFGVGFPVYGVPVQATGTFDRRVVDEWKRTHCASQADERQFHQSIYDARRWASPAIVNAWSTCMASRQTGLRCNLSHITAEKGLLSLHWAASHPDDSGPKVSYLGVFGGKCSCPKPDRLTSFTTECVRDECAQLAVHLETSGGRCEVALPVDPGTCDRPSCPEYTFTGERLLDADTTIDCKRIVFKDGAVVRMVNGRKLMLLGRQIISEGTAKIDGRGKAGAPGMPGTPNNGVWDAPEDQYERARDKCANDPIPDDRGGDGGPGDPGGPGATVVFATKPSGAFSIDVDGGPGGAGGAGGKGRRHRNKRSFTCDGCTLDCKGGATGAAGANGAPGRVIHLE